jgi:hypothetical protein
MVAAATCWLISDRFRPLIIINLTLTMLPPLMLLTHLTRRYFAIYSPGMTILVHPRLRWHSKFLTNVHLPSIELETKTCRKSYKT